MKFSLNVVNSNPLYAILPEARTAGERALHRAQGHFLGTQLCLLLLLLRGGRPATGTQKHRHVAGGEAGRRRGNRGHHRVKSRAQVGDQRSGRVRNVPDQFGLFNTYRALIGG